MENHKNDQFHSIARQCVRVYVCRKERDEMNYERKRKAVRIKIECIFFNEDRLNEWSQI